MKDRVNKSMGIVFVYYEKIKRDLNRILIYECRCNERLKGKDEVSNLPTRLEYTVIIHWVCDSNPHYRGLG